MWRLAVVIVTHDSGDEIGACLDALTRATAALAPDIVVIDNGSTDATADVVASRGIRVLPGPNVGFAAGCNRGFAATTGEFVLLLNPDTEVTPDGVTRLVAALDARPDAAVAGPRIVDARGHAELSFDAMLSPLVEARRKLVQAALDHGFGLARAWAARHTRRPRDVDWVSGACLLVRRADAEAVGGLDERYFLYEEDVDFCAAVRARGRAVLFRPDAEVRHLRGRSAARRPAAAARAYHASHLAFYAKHHPRWAPAVRLWQRLTGRDGGGPPPGDSGLPPVS